MKRFFSLFQGRRFTAARRREILITDERTRHDPFDSALTSPSRQFRDSWLPEEEELTPEEKEKKNHKENADFVYEGGADFDGRSGINPADGGPVDYFLDVKGDDVWGEWMTGHGDDVVYHQGGGRIWTFGGNDIVYLSEGLDDGLGQNTTINQMAWLGEGDDKAIGGKGSQYVEGWDGDDCFDLGDGNDIMNGGDGADEFIIDLQNTGTDVITDFVDVGDRISVKNGGAFAQDGDWILTKVDSYDGPSFSNFLSMVFPGLSNQELSYMDSLEATPQFYEIRNADNQVAAIFGVGTAQVYLGSGTNKYQMTASMDSSGIEILTSTPTAFLGSSEPPGSIEFV